MNLPWTSTLIPPSSGTGLRLEAGRLLRLVDVEGGVHDMFYAPCS